MILWRHWGLLEHPPFLTDFFVYSRLQSSFQNNFTINIGIHFDTTVQRPQRKAIILQIWRGFHSIPFFHFKDDGWRGYNYFSTYTIAFCKAGSILVSRYISKLFQVLKSLNDSRLRLSIKILGNHRMTYGFHN